MTARQTFAGKIGAVSECGRRRYLVAATRASMTPDPAAIES
jgi:hypothetical protein